ncbi:amidase [Dethiobacter alkaliphilus AHT 1]|uniref:Amidase n=2 Tax=Dethiobacter TaxID=427925 RepID=C0GCG1_DETAL|nr:amidase [Dethiobacter alkaliphilus AHT 1]
MGAPEYGRSLLNYLKYRDDFMLFIIDMQNDFVDPKRGSMAVKGAEMLIPGILERIKIYEEKGDLIFYTLNIHDMVPEDMRSKEEIKWGQAIYPLLKENLKKHHALEKKYHAISPLEFEAFRQKCADKTQYIKEIELVGVETNVCVLANAVVIKNMFPTSDVIINSSLCLSSDPDLHKKALDIMAGMKMKVRSY